MLHGIVLPFLRAEDTAGADAALMLLDEYCLLPRISRATSFHWQDIQNQQYIQLQVETDRCISVKQIIQLLQETFCYLC